MIAKTGRNDLIDITLVVDRSGSMQGRKSDAEGGINSFIEEQKAQRGEANLTLVQFDTEYEFVHTAKHIQGVPEYKLVPRGSTALLDAVGRSISEATARIEKIPVADRPGAVVFVIVTDGLENSSKEFKKDKIREMIEAQRSKHNWQFIFLGADDSAFSEAASMGIHMGTAGSYNALTPGAAYAAASGAVSRVRCSSMAGDSDAAIADAALLSDDERKAMK